MNTARYTLPLIILAALAISAGTPVQAEAGGYGHGYGHRNHKVYSHSDHIRHNRHGHKYVKYPKKSISINLGGIEFHYRDGGFYPKKYRKYRHHDHRPAIGTCVHRLPHGYKIIRIGHKKYYKHHGTYYRKSRDGYVVVDYPGHHRKHGVLVSGGASDRYEHHEYHGHRGYRD